MLFEQPGDDRLFRATTFVIAWFLVNKIFEAGIALDLVGLGNHGVGSGFDFRDANWRVVGLKASGGLGILWGQLLTVATPGRVELD